MTTPRDPELESMLRQLAGMAATDRSLVLQTLGQAEREKLRLALSESEGIALSPGLSRLIDQCREGFAPPSLTASGAQALVAASDHMTGQDMLDEMLALLVPPRSLVSRLSPWRGTAK